MSNHPTCPSTTVGPARSWVTLPSGRAGPGPGGPLVRRRRLTSGRSGRPPSSGRSERVRPQGGWHGQVGVGMRLVIGSDQRRIRAEDGGGPAPRRGRPPGAGHRDVLGRSRSTYPPICADVARRVVRAEGDAGVVIGGAGSAASHRPPNKVHGARAACATTSNTARLARQHNDRQRALPRARLVATELARRFSTMLHVHRVRGVVGLTCLHRGAGWPSRSRSPSGTAPPAAP